MNRETLERLVVDQYFKEVSADVSALLDAYIAGTPELQEVRTELVKTLGRAERAARPRLPAREQMPALKRCVQRAAERRPSRLGLRTWFRAGTLAAALVLAFVLGGRVDRATPQSNVISRVLARAEAADAHEAADGFWSVSRLNEAVSRHRNPTNPKRLNWSGPFSLVRTGEAT